MKINSTQNLKETIELKFALKIKSIFNLLDFVFAIVIKSFLR